MKMSIHNIIETVKEINEEIRHVELVMGDEGDHASNLLAEYRDKILMTVVDI